MNHDPETGRAAALSQHVLAVEFWGAKTSIPSPPLKFRRIQIDESAGTISETHFFQSFDVLVLIHCLENRLACSSFLSCSS
jgi:hypothetical protein